MDSKSQAQILDELFSFYFVLMPLGKAWIHIFSAMSKLLGRLVS